MPRIADEYLECVVYLYPSVNAAKEGEKFGGSGFLVRVPSTVNEDLGYTYCVTNSHVIREGAATVIRLNTHDGGTDVIPLEQEHWWHHQYGDDLAVCPLPIDNRHYKHAALDTIMFVTEEFIEEYDLGPGDEAFMVGRFVNHQGRERNTPVVRFGNISMMPWEPIRNERGLLQDSFLVETRSLSGFSGSPVFVYHTPFSPVPIQSQARQPGYRLLGVCWGHMRTFERVMEENRKDPVPEKWVVPTNSGQMQVVPAWKLQELLEREELANVRRLGDEQLAKQIEETPAVFDAQGPPETDTSPLPFTKDDFEDALDRAIRRESPPGQES